MLLSVILCQEMKRLGRVGDVVEVKRGYAHYLMRYSYAIRATAENVRRVQEEREAIVEAAKQKCNVTLELFASAHKKMVIVICQASEDGRLFGSVKPRDIMVSFERDGVVLAKDHVVIRTPIKSTGIHRVPFSGTMDHDYFFYVNVARTLDEARAAEELFLHPDRAAASHDETKDMEEDMVASSFPYEDDMLDEQE